MLFWNFSIGAVFEASRRDHHLRTDFLLAQISSEDPWRCILFASCREVLESLHRLGIQPILAPVRFSLCATSANSFGFYVTFYNWQLLHRPIAVNYVMIFYGHVLTASSTLPTSFLGSHSVMVRHLHQPLQLQPMHASFHHQL